MRQTLWCLMLVGCGVAEQTSSEPLGASSRTDLIVGGTLTSGDPAVVALSSMVGANSYQAFCTGTLVGPKTVLTAAHCLSTRSRSAVYVVFGPSDSSPTQVVRAVSQTAHSQYRATGGRAYDFGVVRLERAVLNVAPIPMNGDSLNSFVGQPIRHVGYGITDPNLDDSGNKREVTYTLRRVEPLLIESGAANKQTCQGDSGGPAFMRLVTGQTERLVGIVSYGSEDCEETGYDGRVDVVLPWVQQTMAAWETPTCASDGLCLAGCAPVDPDCACAADGQCTAACTELSRDPDCPADCAANGVCSTQRCPVADVDCVPMGQRCASALQCEARTCVNDAQNTAPYCSLGCAVNTDCPSSMDCVTGACRLRQRTPRNLLESCVVSADFCVDSECNGPAGGITRCVQGCGSNSDCASGSTCEGGANGQRYCRPSGVSFSNVVLPSTAVLAGTPAPGCASVGGLDLAGLALLLSAARRRAKKA